LNPDRGIDARLRGIESLLWAATEMTYRRPMRIGVNTHLFGRSDAGETGPSWASIHARAVAAEAAGFDSFVFEDSLSYHWKDGRVDGVWESVSMAGAIAAVTDRIDLGQSVFNSPLRAPAMVAAIADTLDEISGGRFVLGIGAGNSPDADYAAFGHPSDHRYSRFAEAIQIIHSLLKTGSVDFEGEYYTAKDCQLVLRGPRPGGPPINMAGRGPKMLQLVARYADAWNWWSWDETTDEIAARLAPIIDQLDTACEVEGRDPATLARTFDIFTVVPEGFDTDGMTVYHQPMSRPITGSSAEIADYVLRLGSLGFGEVRCDVYPQTTEAVEALEPVVARVHAG
jgi:alkanesulfonate monooxygenase SsuD/methylene tetrahydromethanopterin reductase-like flavin-dependent oxidoreductase (luciferase family)